MAMIWESDTVARYEALLRASAALALHRSIADLMHVLADQLHAVVPFEYMALVLHEAATDEMRLLVLEPRDLPKPDVTRAPVAFGGPGATVWHTQKPTVIPLLPRDALSPPLDYIRSLGMTVTCWLPLTTAHGRLGVLSFGSSHANDYAPDAIAFMEQVASHVAVAVDNTLNFDRARELQTELRSERDRLRLLLDVNNLLVSNLDANALLAAISESLRGVIAHDSLSLAVHDEATRTLNVALACEHGAAVQPEHAWPVDGSPAGVAFQRREPTMFDRQELDRFPEGGTAGVSRTLERLCCVPLVTRHKPIGTLNLGSVSADAFRPEDVRLLAQMSIQIAIAVENALAYRAMEERHGRVLDEKTYLEDEVRVQHDFSDVIGSSAPLTRVLHAVATVAPTDATVLIGGGA